MVLTLSVNSQEKNKLNSLYKLYKLRRQEDLFERSKPKVLWDEN